MRIHRKVKKTIFIIAGISLFVVALGAAVPPCDNYTPPFQKPQMDITDAMNTQFDSLLKIYGKHKIIPKPFEKQIIYALSFFPELVNDKIEFAIVKGDDNIIATRPLFSSVFKRSSNRSYIVTIQDSSQSRKLPSFVFANANGQVGILGHELCHIVYFKNRTGFGLIGLGINHISTRFMDRFENKTDSMDIERGLGYQLINWAEFIQQGFQKMNNGNAPPFNNREPSRERYMSVASIKRVMSKSKVYE